MDKVFFTIGEVAEELGVNQSWIRFYEDKLDMPGFLCSKNAKGTRKFSIQQVENCRLLLYLINEKKLTADGAKLYLKNNGGARSKKDLVIERLKKVRNLLEAQIEAYTLVIEEAKNKE
ncbi:MAG: MerR family transcriptional regulator [Paludibacteraceae bacterium]|nr:MerR family transcriptional regulator [Candidatus Physcocola equi]MCQ2234432.1 MerR family transcriptional regulator [Paludibacteraceae bacterium]